MSTGPADPSQPSSVPYGPPSGSSPDPYGPSYQQSYGQPSTQPYGQPQTQPYGQPPVPYAAPYAAPPPTEPLATPSMVVGIVALVLTFICGIGMLGSPVALVMGRISQKRIDRSQGQLGGRGYATAGFILGIVGTVLLVLTIAVIVFFVVLGATGHLDEGSSNA